jgi:hypothetical protein
MAVITQVTNDDLIITLTGIDALWALKRKLVESRATITSAKVFDRKATIRLHVGLPGQTGVGRNYVG